MCELEGCRLEGRCGIALLQEPFATTGDVWDLPRGFTVFTDLAANAAIVVSEPNYVDSWV